MTDAELLSTMDASVWAKEFVRLFGGDEALMIGWFANAIMTGHDHAERKKDNSKISDGYHTFEELYKHRDTLFVALMKTNPNISWRANNHSDGTMYSGFFVAGMHLPIGDITYHLPLWRWTTLDGVGISTTNKAPEYDGHTPEDVLARLQDFIQRQIK